VTCTTCGGSNRDSARFCARCGTAQTPPTSSSGRQPWSPDERDDYLRRRSAERAGLAALAVPALTGDGLRDLARAEEHYATIDALWKDLDMELKRARSEAGLIPTAADAAAVADLQRRTGIAWGSRQAAKAHRDRLWEEEQLTWHTPGMGLPPGPDLDPPGYRTR
jgi:hypothetical protein